MAKRKTEVTEDNGVTNFINFNRVLHKSDYQVFGAKYRKEWEIALALHTLRSQGATSPDALILGAGAARERTIYELANGQDARFVFATDLYLDMGAWQGWAGKDFLMNPAKGAPTDIAFDARRIIPQHVDMRNIPYQDGTFDGIFSSGSIEHVNTNGKPDYGAIAQAARELGRVVKPGGVISLSTEWRLAGTGWGWANVVLFDEDTLMKYVVEPSDCELIDTPDWSFDGDLADAIPLVQMVNGYRPDFEYVLSEAGFVFTSVHVALRKVE